VEVLIHYSIPGGCNVRGMGADQPGTSKDAAGDQPVTLHWGWRAALFAVGLLALLTAMRATVENANGPGAVAMSTVGVVLMVVAAMGRISSVKFGEAEVRGLQYTKEAVALLAAGNTDGARQQQALAYQALMPSLAGFLAYHDAALEAAQGAAQESIARFQPLAGGAPVNTGEWDAIWTLGERRIGVDIRAVLDRRILHERLGAAQMSSIDAVLFVTGTQPSVPTEPMPGGFPFAVVIWRTGEPPDELKNGVMRVANLLSGKQVVEPKQTAQRRSPRTRP
jgi:hypothetical protein